MALSLTSTLLVAVHTAVKTAIDAGAGAGYLSIYNAGGTRLSVLPFTDPCGTVNATTGQLTVVFGSRDAGAEATGTASYARVFDSTGVALINNLPCVAGSAPVADSCVISSLSIVLNSPVEGVSFTIG